MNIGFCNKVEFVKEVSKKVVKGNKKLANEYVDAVFEVLQEQILDGNGVSINGIGKFHPYITKEKVSIDLSKKDSNGKLMRDSNGKLLTKVIPPRYDCTFKFVPSFKTKVKSTPIN